MMQEQEMQFADPDWKPTGSLSAQPPDPLAGAISPVSGAGVTITQTMYAAPPASGQPAYSQGYQGAPPQESLPADPLPVTQGPYASQMSAQPFDQQKATAATGASRGRRGSGVRLWVAILIIILGFSMLGSFRHVFVNPGNFMGGAISVPNQVVEPQQQSYDLNGATQITINDLNGNIDIQVDDSLSSQIVVSDDSENQPQTVYQGTTLTLTANDTGNLTVAIPQGIALHLSGGTNTIQLDNYSGLLTAQTNDGQIVLNNATLSSGSSLNTNSGSIDMEQGSLADSTVTSSTGDLTLNGVDLSGKVILSTSGQGTISYTGGILDPRGLYQFTTESGSVSLNLPQDVSMQLKVTQSDASAAYHSDFQNSTGSAPQAVVIINTASGEVDINRQ